MSDGSPRARGAQADHLGLACWLDTGEPIRAVAHPDGGFQATAEVAVGGGPTDHHAIGATPEEARDRLHRYVAGLRRQATIDAPRPAESLTIRDVSHFLGLRLSQRRGLAERFGLDMRPDPAESDFSQARGWLSEAKALGRLDEVLLAARGMRA